MATNNRGFTTPSRAAGPGHYGTLGVPQSASRLDIMRAHNALESKAIRELTSDEPTAEQEAAKAARLEQLRTAARTLDDPRDRELYDRQLRGETTDWAAEARNVYRDYHDRSGERPQVRSHPAGGIRYQPRPHDRDRTPVTYPNTWIAAVDGRDWYHPSPRAASPHFRPRRWNSPSRERTSRRSSPSRWPLHNSEKFTNAGRPTRYHGGNPSSSASNGGSARRSNPNYQPLGNRSSGSGRPTRSSPTYKDYDPSQKGIY